MPDIIVQKIKTTVHKYTYYLSLFVFSVALSLASGPTAYANPEGGNVVAGNASINQSPGYTEINQSSNAAAINWNSFNINNGETTRFNQPSSSSVTLNRILGNNASAIFGNLIANGKIILVNPSGIMFGAGSRVDVAGLIATTANISNEDFMAGNYHFTQTPGSTGYVINRGTINAAEGGLVALVAPGVENSGVINARLGKVALASGNEYTVDLNGDQLINISVGSDRAATNERGELMRDAVNNSGSIIADGGSVQISANVAENVVDRVINNTGVIQANTIGTRGGEISIGGGDKGIVRVSGKLNVSGLADGESGGTIRIAGEKVGLEGVTINASGKRGGGTVLVGGDYKGGGKMKHAKAVYVDASSVINADAIDSGNGGKVVVWSDDSTRFYGKISARGGANGGDGGVIETSGKNWLDTTGARIDASSPKGNSGSWLLDPTDVVIVSSGSSSGGTFVGSPDVWTPNVANPTVSQILNTDIENALNAGTSVIISTNSGATGTGNITQNATITKSAGGTAFLTYNAANSITINANITNTSTSGLLNLFLDGGNLNQAAQTNYNGAGGTVTLASGVAITTLGGNVTVVNGGSIVLNNATINTSGSDGAEGASQGDSGAAGNSAGSINLLATGNISLTNSTLLADGGDGGQGADNSSGASGAGGNGGNASSITLGANGTISVSGGTISAQGGLGNVAGNATGGNGGNGGVGGTGGLITLAGNAGSSISNATIDASGGNGGVGGSSNGGLLGNGGSGGNGGALNLSDNQSYTFNTVTLNTFGGAGASFTDTGGATGGGAGGAGGIGGAVNITAPTVNGTGLTISSFGGVGALAENGSGGAGGAGGNVTVNASTALTLASSTINSFGGDGGSSNDGGGAGGAGGAQSYLSNGSTSTSNISSSLFNSSGGAGGQSLNSVGGNGGNAGAQTFKANTLTMTDATTTTTGGAGGTPSGVTGANSTVTLLANILSLRNTTGALTIANLIIGNQAGTAAPTNFTFRQNASIADANIPLLSQYIGNSITGMVLSLITDTGNINVSTQNKVDGTALTLNANGIVTISPSLTALQSLDIIANGGGVSNLFGLLYTTLGGDINITTVGGLTLNSNTTFVSNNGDITFDTAIDDATNFAHSLTVAAGTGDVIFDGAVGSQRVFNALTVLSAKDLTINGTIALSASGGANFSATNSGNTIVNAAITTSGINGPTGGSGSQGTSGGTGGNAGSITFNTTGSFALNSANLTADGGNGGTGGNSSGDNNNGGNGGNGGAAGAISVTANTIDITNGTLSSRGGQGGNGGNATGSPSGAGGIGGNSGNSGAVTLASTNGSTLSGITVNTQPNTAGHAGNGVNIANAGGAAGAAGAITITDNNFVTIDNSTFIASGGSSGAAGGGIGPAVPDNPDGGDGAQIAITAPVLTMTGVTLTSNGGTGGGNAGSPVNGGDGGNGGAINLTGTNTATLTNLTVNSAGGNGGSSTGIGGTAGSGGSPVLKGTTLTVVNPTFNTAAGAGGGGTVGTWTLLGDTLTLQRTDASNISVTNGRFGNFANTAAPTNFTFRQVNSITDGLLPALSQYVGGSINGMIYTIQSDNGDITLAANPNKVDGTALTLTAPNGGSIITTTAIPLGGTSPLVSLVINASNYFGSQNTSTGAQTYNASNQISLQEATTTTGDITFNGPILLLDAMGDLQINSTSGDVAFNGTINSETDNQNRVNIDVGTGDVFINGIVGGSVRPLAIIIDAANDVNVNAAVRVGSEGFRVTNSGDANINANIIATGLTGGVGSAINGGAIRFVTAGDFTATNASLLSNGAAGAAGGGNAGSASSIDIAANNITMTGDGTQLVSAAGGAGGSNSAGNGGTAGTSNTVTLNATNNVTVNGVNVSTNGGNGGSSTAGGSGRNGTNASAVTVTAGNALSFTNSAITAQGGNGGNSATSPGGNGGNGSNVNLTANSVTLTNSFPVVTGGSGGTGTSTGTTGTAGTWNIHGNTIDLVKTTSGLIDFTNLDKLSNQANTSNPNALLVSTADSISDTDLPNTTQFLNNNVNGLNYTIRSTGGDVTLTNSGKVANSNLTASAANNVNMTNPLNNLTSLNAYAGNLINLNDVSTTGGQLYQAGVATVLSKNTTLNSGASMTIAGALGGAYTLTVNAAQNLFFNNVGTSSFGLTDISATANYISGRIVAGDTYFNGATGIDLAVNVSSLLLQGNNGANITGSIDGVSGIAAASLARVVIAGNTDLLDFIVNGCPAMLGCTVPQQVFNESQRAIAAQTEQAKKCTLKAINGSTDQFDPDCDSISIDDKLQQAFLTQDPINITIQQ